MPPQVHSIVVAEVMSSHSKFYPNTEQAEAHIKRRLKDHHQYKVG